MKTQQPSLERPQERRRVHDLLDTSSLEADPESTADERPRAHRGAFTRGRRKNQTLKSHFLHRVEQGSPLCGEQKFMHVRMEALSGMFGNSTTFQTQESQPFVCELAPHPSRALHSHCLFVPTALEDHMEDYSTGVRNHKQ